MLVLALVCVHDDYESRLILVQTLFDPFAAIWGNEATQTIPKCNYYQFMTMQWRFNVVKTVNQQFQ